MIDRRTAMASSIAAFLAACERSGSAVLGKASGDFASQVSAIHSIEQAAQGRLGAFVLDPTIGQSFGWRAHERFAHCSSFKLSLAAMLLARADKGEVNLNEILHWSKEDMLSVSPVTSMHVDKGLPVRELARATLVTSDNTAANVLMRRFGGPEAVTRFWRSTDDTVSRLDRYEPELNRTPPGTELDTTTPAAMAATVGKLVLGDVLTPASRTLLRTWMTAVATGRDRVRAGFPVDWVSGDKTGTGIDVAKHTYVDLAFGGPMGKPPIVVTAYFEPERLAEPMDPFSTRVLVDVERLAAAWYLGRNQPATRASIS